MDYDTIVATIANWSAIGTALIAVLAFLQFHLGRRWRKQRLERYLRSLKEINGRFTQVTHLHLMKRLGMSEDELFSAAHRSKKVYLAADRHPGEDRVRTLYFEYNPTERKKMDEQIAKATK